MAVGPGEFSKNSAMETILNQAGISGLGSIIGDTPVRSAYKVSSEYESKQTSQILDPELNLSRLGYSGNEPIDWSKVALPDKKNLYSEMRQRINSRKNADTKVHIGKEMFTCHLIVLQCYSELFDAYVAIKKVEIPSDKCSPTSFAFIYDWMASEEKCYKHLNRQNVLDILNSAKYLKIKDLVEQCWAFVDDIEIFNEETAFLLYVDAKIKKVEEVRDLMVPRIKDFFLTLVSSQDWLVLEVEDVKNLLSSNYIRINCEMEVFMSAVRWLKYDWANRDRFKYEVLNCVRFGNIAPWQLVDIKRNPENLEFMDLAKDPAICKLIDDGLAFVIIKYWYGQENEDFQHWNSVLGLHEPPPRNWSGLDKTYFTYREFLIYLDQYRRSKLMEKSKPKAISDKKTIGSSTVMIEEPVPSIEDFLTKKKDEDINYDEEEENEIRNVKRLFTHDENRNAYKMLNRLSKTLLSPPQKKLLGENSLFLRNRETILVFGGVDPFAPLGFRKNTGKSIFRYLPDHNSWEYVGDMPEPRHHHSIAFMKGRIYLAGGTDPRDNEIRGNARVMDTVWSFDPSQRSWFSEKSLGKRRRNFELVTCQEKMYAIGGCDDQFIAMNSVERFDPKQNIWDTVAPMQFARAALACAKYRNTIWVAGGTPDMKKNILLDVVESYDVKFNQWTRIRRVLSPRCFSKVIVMSDKLYLIGGIGHRLKQLGTLTSLATIDLWDKGSLSWKTIVDLTIPRHGHTVAYVGTQIFVLGGVTTIYTRCLNNTECFCTHRGVWVRGISYLPVAVSGHATITVPPAALLSN